jgi:hypothetical protein
MSGRRALWLSRALLGCRDFAKAETAISEAEKFWHGAADSAPEHDTLRQLRSDLARAWN